MKYNVYIDCHDTHRVTVEASSEDEAAELAQDCELNALTLISGSTEISDIEEAKEE